MKIVRLKKVIVLSAVLALVSLSLPFIAGAKSAEAQSGGDSSGGSNSSQTSGPDGSGSETSGSDNASGTQTGKLTDKKLEACENRQANMNNIMSRVVDRASKQLAVFNKISERVQNFYEDKGYHISNYDGLVANVQSKKSAAQSAVQTVAQNGTTLDCGGDSPGSDVQGFVTRAKAQGSALSDYKTAVQDLVSAVQTTAQEVAE